MERMEKKQQNRRLIIGGSGMLRGLVHEFALNPGVTSVMARNEDKLNRLVRDCDHLPGRVMPLAVDYTDSGQLETALQESSRDHGPISLAVSWMHSTAPTALDLVGKLLAEQKTPATMIHLLGSTAANPTEPKLPIMPWAQTGLVSYRRVYLGFKIENNRSRWLTDEEIVGGVVEAIASGRSVSTIGVLEPWERRP